MPEGSFHDDLNITEILNMPFACSRNVYLEIVPDACISTGGEIRRGAAGAVLS